MKKLVFVLILIFISFCVYAQQKDFDIKSGVLEHYNGIGKNIVIPNGVKVIGQDAFSGAETLNSVTLPKTLVSIGNGAFSDCINLKTLYFPETLKEIDDYAFYNCVNLKDINFPSSL